MNRDLIVNAEAAVKAASQSRKASAFFEAQRQISLAQQEVQKDLWRQERLKKVSQDSWLATEKGRLQTILDSIRSRIEWEWNE